MPLATCIQYLRVNSTTIVAYHYPKILACILYLYFHCVRSSVKKRIDEGFTADAVHLVTDRRSHRPTNVVSNDAVTNLFVDGELLTHARKRQLKVAAVGIRRSQTPECISTFFRDTSHQLQHTSQYRFSGGVVRQLIFGNIKLHRSADKTLQ